MPSAITTPKTETARRAAIRAEFVSAPGKHDGLYWAAMPGEPESPLGAAVRRCRSPRRAYHGYHYRILTAQGQSAPGGAQELHHDGRMSTGFALVAWPAEYGKTGVMTFIVNQDGKVYQKNLGPGTDAAVRGDQRVQP